MVLPESKMLCRPPSKRVRCPPCQKVGKPPVGSYLDKILTPTQLKRDVTPKRPVYRQDDYIKLLKKNNKDLGIPYVPQYLPVVYEESAKVTQTEPELDVPDRVYMRLRVLKNGTVRIKLSGTIWDLHNTYYKYAKKPPFKAVLQAYKGHGFSKEYMEKLKMNLERQRVIAQRIEKVFSKIFDKEPVKKPKKEKKKEEEEAPPIEEHEPEEDEIEEEVPDDGGMDIEPEPDDEVVEDEEFLSDGE